MLLDRPPRVLHVPPAASSAGQEAVDLAAQAGLHLDPWQQLVLEHALGERDDGRWSAFEVGLVVARQNGKGAILEARELAGMFLFGERLIIHSAHLFETSMEHMLRILQLIESNPDFDRRVKRVSRAHGEEGIELKSGERLKFKTRTKGGGRGLSGDVVILDEAMELPNAALGALMPTVSARWNPQIWYAGSAVDQNIHQHGVVLARIRERGLKGDDPSLCFIEYSVDPDEYLADPIAVAADPEQWVKSNPGMPPGRITVEYVANEHRSLDPVTFATERLTVGDWPDTTGEESQVIPRPTWDALADARSAAEGTVAFALDVNPERTYAAIGVAGKRPDGRWHVEIIDHRAGTRWVAARIAGLVDRWESCAVLLDGKGPAASLLQELKDAGLDEKDGNDGQLVTVSSQQMAQACGAFYDAATNDELRHLGQSMLDQALASAKQRSLVDAWAWSRKSGGDISPLVSVTLAMHGYQLHSRTEPKAKLGFVSLGQES